MEASRIPILMVDQKVCLAFFCNILQKNWKELFGQPNNNGKKVGNTKIKTAIWGIGLIQGIPVLGLLISEDDSRESKSKFDPNNWKLVRTEAHILFLT